MTKETQAEKMKRYQVKLEGKKGDKNTA